MKCKANHMAAVALFIAASAITSSASAAQTTQVTQASSERPAGNQLVERFTPPAQYQLSQREAHAAYGEALKQCHTQVRSERAACTADARKQLQQDLAYARENFNRDRQMTADNSPGAAYQRSRRGAHAAYDESVAHCRQLTAAEQGACTQEAKAQLQHDLAYARNRFGSGENSVGSSATESGGASGAGSNSQGR